MITCKKCLKNVVALPASCSVAGVFFKREVSADSFNVVINR
jgi:hypothetical protein